MLQMMSVFLLCGTHPPGVSSRVRYVGGACVPLPPPPPPSLLHVPESTAEPTVAVAKTPARPSWNILRIVPETASGGGVSVPWRVSPPQRFPGIQRLHFRIRTDSSLFDRTLKERREEESFTVEVSYMEIYNERVRDLLDPK
ncbi:hypothetical protein CRUP_017877, partial [Coryphaenoides rupestris]